MVHPDNPVLVIPSQRCGRSVKKIDETFLVWKKSDSTLTDESWQPIRYYIKWMEIDVKWILWSVRFVLAKKVSPLYF